jgi:hypothetical protein
VVYGDWISDDYKGIQFVMTRVDTYECSANIAEGSRHLITGVMESAKACAAVEDYVAEGNKMMCTTCGTNFKLKKPAPPPPQNTNAQNLAGIQGVLQQALGQSGQASSSFGPQWSQTTESLFDSKFSDAELDDLISELGEDPNNFPAKSDKLSFVLGCLFS